MEILFEQEGLRPITTNSRLQPNNEVVYTPKPTVEGTIPKPEKIKTSYILGYSHDDVEKLRKRLESVEIKQ
jgi:hypothetical protein